MSEIKVERIGRRSYITGNTYPHKDALRDAGAHWDAEQRAWWIGKEEEADNLVKKLNNNPSVTTDNDGENTVVAGKATYKGKTYYVAGRIERGRTVWKDHVHPIQTRDGKKTLLVLHNGSKTFWADTTELSAMFHYEKPKTIGSLRRFAEGMKNGSIRTCPNCGSPSCEGARGGHCDED